MIDKTLSYLDYLKLRDVIFKFSQTPFSRDQLIELRPLDNFEEISERHDRIEAVMDIVKWDGKISFGEVPDITPIIQRIGIRDSVLESSEFLTLPILYGPVLMRRLF